MAQDSGQDRTESPTQRRREKAREEGRVPYSSDLSNGLLLAAGAVILWLSGSRLGNELSQFVRVELLRSSRDDWGGEQTIALAWALGAISLQWLGPLLLGLLLVALAAGAWQSGSRVTSSPLKLDWGKLSPKSGVQRLFSSKAAMRGLMAIVKVLVVGGVVWWIVGRRFHELSSAGSSSLIVATAATWNLAMVLAVTIGAAQVLLGIVDYLFQWWRHEQDLRMSRQDVRDEQKEEEGDPHVKTRLRKMQREAAKRRMLADVPQATVVLTNPTHLAVALRYDRDQMAAPKVVAKGSGATAKRIVGIATRHGVPVLERKPLARALYGAVAVGQEIPMSLYRAIAEILAHIYGMRRTA